MERIPGLTPGITQIEGRKEEDPVKEAKRTQNKRTSRSVLSSRPSEDSTPRKELSHVPNAIEK